MPPESGDGRLVSLCDALLDGFHAAAQPLTILTMSLSPECTSFLDDEAMRELVGESARETARMARIFRMLKHLVLAYRVPAKLERFKIGEVLKLGIAGEMDSGGAGAVVRIESPLPDVWADAEGTTELLEALMDTVRANAPEQGEVSITAREEGGRVKLSFLDAGRVEPKLAAEYRVALELARVWMEIQKGTLTWNASPLSIELGFKAVEAGMRGAI